jgi:hypothetical protein
MVERKERKSRDSINQISIIHTPMIIDLMNQKREANQKRDGCCEVEFRTKPKNQRTKIHQMRKGEESRMKSTSNSLSYILCLFVCLLN